MKRVADRPGPLLAVGVVVEVVALVVTVLVAGGGHGSYAPAKVLFPYTMALTGVAGSITIPLVWLALGQYPLYSLVMWILRGARARRWRWFGLTSVHVLAIVWAFVSADSSFEP